MCKDKIEVRQILISRLRVLKKDDDVNPAGSFMGWILLTTPAYCDWLNSLARVLMTLSERLTYEASEFQRTGPRFPELSNPF